MTVWVVGAGMAGLAAAHRLSAEGLSVEVLERGPYVGGRVAQIVTEEGFRFDRAAEFYCSFYPETRRLIDEVGLHSEVVEINGPGALLTEGKLVPMIAGPLSALSTPLLSMRTKLRLSKLSATLLSHLGQLDIADPTTLAPADDASVEEYVLSRFGKEFLEFGVRPGLESLTLSPAAETSKALFLAQTQESATARFFCLNGGMGRLAERLAQDLTVHLGQSVTAIHADADGVRIDRDGADPVTGEAAVVALPGPIAASLLDAPMLQQSRYAKAVKLNLGLDEQIPLGYPGVIPRSHPRVAGLQFLAWKGTGQAPAGCDGLGVVFRETGPIEELTDTALELLASLPGVKRPPQVVARHLERIPHGVPLFPPGRYRALADSDPLLGRVALAGDYLAGPSIEAAVRSGLAAAMSLTRVLRR